MQQDETTDVERGPSGRRLAPVRDLFMKKVRHEADTGCWRWTAYRDTDGYGQFAIRGKNISAHRAAYMIFVGPIPEGLQIDHLCRVRSCVNPEHLEVVTPQENTRRGLNSALRPPQTHCVNGHEWTPENIRHNIGSGKHQCRVCDRERQRIYAERRRLSERESTS